VKRIRQSHGEELKPVALYLDDLERIIEIFKEASDDVRILTSEYELDSIDEFRNLHEETLNYLKISISEPFVSLELKPNGIWLFISEDELISRGVFEKIKQLLHSRRRKLSWLTANPYLAGAAVGSSAFPFFKAIDSQNVYWAVLGCSLLMIGAIWTWWSFAGTLKKYSIVRLRRRAESPSFWKRKKDDIVLVIISAVVGALITLAITWAITEL